jgi:hypothetical protein
MIVPPNGKTMKNNALFIPQKKKNCNALIVDFLWHEIRHLFDISADLAV